MNTYILYFEYIKSTLKPIGPSQNGFQYSAFLQEFRASFLNFTLQKNQMAERNARMPKHWRSRPNFWLSLSDQPHQMFILARRSLHLCHLQIIRISFLDKQMYLMKTKLCGFVLPNASNTAAWSAALRLSYLTEPNCDYFTSQQLPSFIMCPNTWNVSSKSFILKVQLDVAFLSLLTEPRSPACAKLTLRGLTAALKLFDESGVRACWSVGLSTPHPVSLIALGSEPVKHLQLKM